MSAIIIFLSSFILGMLSGSFLFWKYRYKPMRDQFKEEMNNHLSFLLKTNAQVVGMLETVKKIKELTPVKSPIQILPKK